MALASLSVLSVQRMAKVTGKVARIIVRYKGRGMSKAFLGPATAEVSHPKKRLRLAICQPILFASEMKQTLRGSKHQKLHCGILNSERVCSSKNADLTS